MAASPNLQPWFETARYARLLTMRPNVLNHYQIAKIERFTGFQDDGETHVFAADQLGTKRTLRYHPTDS
jgi:hypothetical protein